MALLPRADRGGRLEPVELGHLHVHEHEVEGSLLQGGDGLAAVGRDHGGVPRLLEHAHRHLLVDRIVLRQQHAQPATLHRPAGGAPGPLALARRAAEHAHDRVQEVGLLDGLGQVGGRLPGRAARPVARAGAGGEHHDRGAGEPGTPADLLGQRETVHLGHLGVHQHEGIGLALAGRLLELLQGPPVRCPTTVGRMRQWRSISWRMRRLVALSSTTRTRRRRRVQRAAAPAAACPGRPKRRVKRKLLPLPGLAVHREAAPHQVHELRRRWRARGRCRRSGGWWSRRPGRRPRR